MNPQIGAVTQTLPFFIGQYKIGWRRIFNFWIGFIGGLLLAGGISGWRKILPIDVLTHREIGVDKTSVNTGIKRQIRDQITLIYTHRNGRVIRVLANKDAYSEFVNQNMEYLENRRIELHHQMKIMLEGRLNLIFQELDNRVSNYSDWYFSYGTHYKILWEASSTAFLNLLSPDTLSAVEADLQHLILKQYQDIVWKPENASSKIELLVKDTLEIGREEYLKTISQMEDNVQVFLQQQTTSFSGDLIPELSVHIDWPAQVNKLEVNSDVVSSLSGLRGVGFLISGVMIGKALGSKIGISIAVNMAKPIIGAAKGATGGAAGGVSIGGPVGAVVGGIVGIGVGIATDWITVRAVEHYNKEGFKADVREALSTSKKELQGKLLLPLKDGVDAWFEDAMNLLVRFKR